MNYGKKKKKTTKSEIDDENIVDLDPLTEGLSGLQSDGKELLEVLILL